MRDLPKQGKAGKANVQPPIKAGNTNGGGGGGALSSNYSKGKATGANGRNPR